MAKIFHTGDLHLDSAFACLRMTESDKARENQRLNFSAMMKYAADSGADIILISGDMFDSRYITKATEELVIKTFSSLTCPVVISPGNHDPYAHCTIYSSGKLPPNVYVFNSEEMQMFEFNMKSDNSKACVFGYAFLDDRLDTCPVIGYTPEIPAEENESTLSILCAHADITSHTSKYACTTAADIAHGGFDYAALGHIHNPPEPIKIGKTLISYCGFPLGRSFDELGYGGAMWITTDGKNISAERIIFASHRYITENLDISGTRDTEEISEKIKNLISTRGYAEETFLRVILCGTVSEDCVIDPDNLSAVCGNIGMLDIRDETLPMPDENFLEHDITLRGELYRTLLPKIQSGTPEERKTAAEALRIGLAVMDGRNTSGLL